MNRGFYVDPRKRDKKLFNDMKRRIENLNRPSESDNEAHLVREIKKLGGECPKITNPGERGWPDRKAIVPPGFEYWVEVKKETGVLSPNQEIVIARLARIGIKVYVLFSKQEVDEFIKMVKNDILFKI